MISLEVVGEDLEERIRSLLGLSGYGTRAYLALLKLGAARPSEISREAGIPPQRVYDILGSLSNKDLVYEEDGIYRVIEPERAIGALAERIVAEARERARRIGELADLLSGMMSKPIVEHVELVRGIDGSISHAIAAIRSCGKRPVFMAYKVVERADELWPKLSYLLEALPRDVHILVPEKADIRREYLEALEARGISLIRSSAVMMDLMIACNTVIMGLPSSRHDVISIVVRNRVFAEALERRLEELIR